MMDDKDYIMNEVARPSGENDLKETIREMNDDTMGADGFSNIDMRTRLNQIQLPNIVACDMLVKLKVYPTVMSDFTRLHKRLAISLKGEGRKEAVEIVRADRESKKGQTMAGQVMG